jgi:predicted dithiol-disulfide oxidoreductase (DUF899 family)
MEEHIPHPPIVARPEWESARAQLLLEEKALTKMYDRVAAQRRRLPMVHMDKPYRFTGAEGDVSFAQLFAGKRQLIMYHFMYGPQNDVGCPVCTGFMLSLPDLASLEKRDSRFVIVARAPFEKLDAHRVQSGIRFPFYSSFQSDFNYDMKMSDPQGEGQGISVFFRLGDSVYHTYTALQRGVEGLSSAQSFLDRTPYGRQEDFEDSPPGWPQYPTYG